MEGGELPDRGLEESRSGAAVAAVEGPESNPRRLLEWGRSQRPRVIGLAGQGRRLEARGLVAAAARRGVLAILFTAAGAAARGAAHRLDRHHEDRRQDRDEEETVRHIESRPGDGF